MALHPVFDLVYAVVIDDLPGLFLGVTLSLLRLWLDKTHRGKPHFIGNKVYMHKPNVCILIVVFSCSCTSVMKDYWQ